MEDSFLELITFVPLSKEHEEVWSLKLANLLLLIGSSIESFFQCAISSLRFSGIYQYLEIPHGRVWYVPEDFISSRYHERLLSDEKPNMGLYRDIFKECYDLSNKTVYILRNMGEITPFEEWNNDRSPGWWKNYTDIKHEKYKNLKSATLKTVLNSLAALFLLNIYHFDTRSYLVSKGIIRGNVDLNNYTFLKSKERLDTLQPIIAKTNLFGYVWETTGHWGQYPWNILDPGNIYDL